MGILDKIKKQLKSPSLRSWRVEAQTKKGFRHAQGIAKELKGVYAYYGKPIVTKVVKKGVGHQVLIKSRRRRR